MLLLFSDPPPDPPVISGYGGQPLYSGDFLRITCDVTGGRPTVEAVKFTCEGQGQEQPGQRERISKQLSPSDHGKVCSCSARWKKSEWYTKANSVTLHVYCKSVPTYLPFDKCS